MRSPAAASYPQPGSLGFNLAGIALLALLLAVGAAYVIDMLGENNRTAPPRLSDKPSVNIAVAGTELTIPASWFRQNAQSRGGFVNQIDLHVLLGAASTPVDVTLLPRSRVRPSDSLLDAVYLHEFGSATLGGVPGLVGKPLHDGDGLNGETVWYDPLAANPFVAKCVIAVAATIPARCLRTVFLPSGIAAVYAFDATALQSWRQFDSDMQKWLGRIGAW